jgi:hypothetical protein
MRKKVADDLNVRILKLNKWTTQHLDTNVELNQVLGLSKNSKL